MEEVTLPVLPYALEIDEKGMERDLPKEAEIALLFLLIESEFKKLFKKFKGIVKISFITKIYYPLWIAPWKEDIGLIIDGLNIFPQIIYYHEIPNYTNFIEGIKKSSTEEYLNKLREYSLNFLDFKGSRSLIISIFPRKDIIFDIQSCIIHYKKDNITNALSLNPKLSWQQVSNFIQILKESEADIKTLNGIRKDLIEKTNEEIGKLKKEIENIQKRYSTKIESDKTEDKIKELQVEYQSKVDEVNRRMEEEIKSLMSESIIIQKEIQNLQEKQKEYSKVLEDLNEQSKTLSKQLDILQRKRNELSNKLLSQTAQLETLKMERNKLEDLAEARKGIIEELSLIRERLLQINGEMNKIGEFTLQLERELRQENEKREVLQDSLIKLNKQIGDLERLIKDSNLLIMEKKDRLTSISYQIEDVKKRRHEEILKIDKEYRVKFDEMRDRIKILQSEMTQKIENIKRWINEIIMRTDKIVLQIDRLSELKSSFIRNFLYASVYLPKNLKFDTPIMLEIPFYMVCYETMGERKYNFYSPIVIKRVYKILPFKKIYIRMKIFDQIMKNKIYELMEQDFSFENELLNCCIKLNLLERSGIFEDLIKGINQLKLRKLISNKEASKVMVFLSKYALKRGKSLEKHDLRFEGEFE
ncbi:MAG: hypothetical protein QXW83_02270 [Nitrososphaerales archaeon]